MNLQTDLGAVQNNVLFARWALVAGVQSGGLLGNAGSVSQQVQFLHQLVAFGLVLPSERVGIGATLDFVPGK